MDRADIFLFRWHLFFALLSAFLFLAGCGKTSLSKSKQRAITNEIVAAAQKSADPKTKSRFGPA